MVEVGQLAIKIAGRDSGNFCAVVEIVDDAFVLIDGNVRKKKCNIKHLEFLDKKLDIKKGASSEAVKKELEKLGIKILKTGKKREAKPRPIKQRKIKIKEDKKEAGMKGTDSSQKKEEKSKKEDKKTEKK
ncbi:MAG: 50S ribosomal protein L14e [Nanoarchaeota archaeon]|jgi:large subunit ribosomal protein L14e|nr:50S ribosomal protein L14e [Nanoarchaeota archaeon]|tara:strand:- start:18750 stop:19139 length:390 start_codon:yes stop_codon:yes gene_type:complete